MSSYDFQALNDKEFESLVVDLLSAEFGFRIERFKPGRDAGVDGRWFASSGKECVVQCKHWIKSGLTHLLRSINASEHQKVDRLNPERYVFATSLPLSRIDKKTISAAFAPHIKTSADVLGSEDLNDLLGRHPAVERRHFKLWLSSTNALTLLLNNAIVGRSRAEIEEIRSRAAQFVPTLALAEASDHLDEKRIVVLTGAPGIGKTTLAQQLVLQHVAEGFELIVMEESISEAEAVYSDDAKQLFYFDDFLGSTFLAAIRAKQDSHVLRLISGVARDPRKRFILTSRTNILNQGATLSDSYSDGRIVRNTYELNISHLSTLDRAHILYNHIWHSSLSSHLTDELFRKKRYHQIIRHANFNPRLVAFIVDAGKVNEEDSKRYWAYVLHTFNHPGDVWRQYFAAQLSQDDRDITFLVVLNGGSIEEQHLRSAFKQLASSDSANEGLHSTRFSRAIRHATGAVLNRSLRTGTSTDATYTLYNPSIADFVQSELALSGLWECYFRFLRTTSALTYLEQLAREPFFGNLNFQKVLQKLATAEAEREIERDNYSLTLTRLLATYLPKQTATKTMVETWMSRELATDEPLASAEYAAVLSKSADMVSDQVLNDRLDEFADFLAEDGLPFDDPHAVSSILDTCARFGARGAGERVREQVIAQWTDSLSERLSEENALSSFDSQDQAEEAAGELRSFVMDQLADLGVTLTDAEADSICDSVDVSEIISNNIEINMRDNDPEDRWRQHRDSIANEERAIDDLFDRSNQ